MRKKVFQENSRRAKKIFCPSISVRVRSWKIFLEFVHLSGFSRSHHFHLNDFETGFFPPRIWIFWIKKNFLVEISQRNIRKTSLLLKNIEKKDLQNLSDFWANKFWTCPDFAWTQIPKSGKHSDWIFFRLLPKNFEINGYGNQKTQH